MSNRLLNLFLSLMFIGYSLVAAGTEVTKQNRKPASSGQFFCSSYEKDGNTKLSLVYNVQDTMNQICDPSKPFSITGPSKEGFDTGSETYYHFCCIAK